MNEENKEIKKGKIDPSTAAADFVRWAERRHIDTDVDSMDDEDKTAFNKQKKRVIYLI